MKYLLAFIILLTSQVTFADGFEVLRNDIAKRYNELLCNNPEFLTCTSLQYIHCSESIHKAIRKCDIESHVQFVSEQVEKEYLTGKKQKNTSTKFTTCVTNSIYQELKIDKIKFESCGDQSAEKIIREKYAHP